MTHWKSARSNTALGRSALVGRRSIANQARRRMVKTGVGCAGRRGEAAETGAPGGGTGESDGSVEVRCGTQDSDGDAHSGCAGGRRYLRADTDKITRRSAIPVPYGNDSGGSTPRPRFVRRSMMLRHALAELQKQAGGRARGRIGRRRAEAGREPWCVAMAGGLSSTASAGCSLRVEWTRNGFVKVKKITCVQDCGLVVSKLTCESQVNGGIIIDRLRALRRAHMDRHGVSQPNFETTSSRRWQTFRRLTSCSWTCLSEE